jgi:serine protease AprX
MLEANPHLTPSDIKDILRYSATPLPNYYVHEVGAGMLNSHAAVLEAAFPSRPVGIFRSGIDNDAVRFSTSMTESSNGQVAQNTVSSKLSPVPWGTVQATAYVAWGASFMNNLGLKAYDANGFLVGASDRLNFPYGRNSECVTVNFPAAGDLRTEVGYSGDSTGGSTLQNFLRAIEVTTLEFARFNDIDDVNSQDQAIIYEGLRKGLIYPTGASFSPGTSVTRAEFAAALLRSGKVPQYTARNPMYVDVTSQTDRNAIESAQLFAGGPLFFDGGGSVSFKLDQNATRLLTAVALIKAAGLESAAATATLPVTLIDAGSVPAQYRGYVALALQKGWMTAPNNKFDQNGRLTRLELTRAMVRLSR